MKDTLQIIGTVTIYDGKKEDGKVVKTYKNMFLDSGKQAIISMLTGKTTSVYGIGYNYLVIGDGKTAVSAQDIKLVNERFRKTISSVTVYGNRIIVDVFIDNVDANFTDGSGNATNWKELGLVSGGSLGTPNSGTLLNRVLIDEVKTNSNSKTISWEISIT
jgi:hypothetical protein